MKAHFFHISWYFFIFSADVCIFGAYICILLLISAYIVHTYAYFEHELHIYMHIPILQVPCTGQLRPFLFHSCSTWQQATLLPVNTLILTVTCHVNLAPTLAPGWAGSWLCQNTWFIKLRKPSGLPSASPSWVESVMKTESEKNMRYMQNMPRLLGKIMKINFLTAKLRTWQANSSSTFPIVLYNRQAGGKRRPNSVAPSVVKPPAVDWLGRTDKVSAVIAVKNKSINKLSPDHYRPWLSAGCRSLQANQPWLGLQRPT